MEISSHDGTMHCKCDTCSFDRMLAWCSDVHEAAQNLARAQEAEDEAMLRLEAMQKADDDTSAAEAELADHCLQGQEDEAMLRLEAMQKADDDTPAAEAELADHCLQGQGGHGIHACSPMPLLKAMN